MKKMLSLLFCILLMMSAALATAEEAKPLAGKKLTIALSPNFMFFETVSETEECGYEGLDIDIIKELSDMLGFDFEIVPMSFSSLVGSLQAKSVDMVISGMSYTEERAQIVDFSDVYCTAVVGCVTKVDSDIASFDDLKNQIVCCSQGTNYEMLIEGIEGATLKTYQRFQKAGHHDAQRQRRADAQVFPARGRACRRIQHGLPQGQRTGARIQRGAGAAQAIRQAG